MWYFIIIMKDLTDYLCSSINTSDVTNSVASDSKKANKARENEIKTQNSANIKNVQNGRKKKKKKAKRKPSVELLSTSLSIISPNTTVNDQSQIQNQSSERGKREIIEKSNEKNVLTAKLDNTLILEDDETNPSTPPKDEPLKSKNAFEFMMKSRNKSIGQNSPGKDLPKDDNKTGDEKELKEVLSARKKLFQSWVDKKGAFKRKREEEEKDEVINYKLQKRAKRMKRLLKIDKPKDVENGILRKRKIRRISTSSSENSKGSVTLLQETNETLTSTVLEIIEENAQDSVLQSKTKETKQGLLNFFGVINKTSKIQSAAKEDESVKEEKEVSETNTNTSKSKRKKLKSNQNIEDITNKSTKHIIIEESSSDKQMTVKQLKSNKHKKCIETASQESKKLTPKTPKNKIKDNDDNFTPRSLKSWKMKIKLCDENTEITQDEVDTKQKRSRRSKTILDYKLLFLEESSDDGK